MRSGCATRASARDGGERDVLLALLAKEEKRIADGWVSAQEIAGTRGAAHGGGRICTPIAGGGWTRGDRACLL